MIADLKNYKKAYLDTQFADVDESATRLMVHHLLIDVLGYKMDKEIKPEYMISGTYADYIIQIKGKRYFLVEVKAFPLELSVKHLRQAINYAAKEGIDWIVLTNARKLELYHIIFEKPIDCARLFSLDLGDLEQFDKNIENLQYLHRGCILKTDLEKFWKKHSALKPRKL